MLSIFGANNKKGSILIFALWVLVFLTMFAVQIGLSLRAKISLIARIEKRSQLHYLVQAGVTKAISVLRKDLIRNNNSYTVDSKMIRHNNINEFTPQELGLGHFEVFYKEFNRLSSQEEIYFGFVDEERKLNINTADAIEIKRLIMYVLNMDDETAQEITEAIFDWREFGKSQLTGFYSDDYYSNLQYPYPVKDFDFEVYEELMLVKGVTNEIYNRLLPFITVYGEGQVNINTASLPVLVALGLDEPVAEKVLSVRRGNDGVDSSQDDYLFNKTYDIASTVKTFIELTENEMRQIDYLNSKGKITINSFFYFIQSFGQMDDNSYQLTGLSVYNSRNNRIEYWREKY